MTSKVGDVTFRRLAGPMLTIISLPAENRPGIRESRPGSFGELRVPLHQTPEFTVGASTASPAAGVGGAEIERHGENQRGRPGVDGRKPERLAAANVVGNQPDDEPDQGQLITSLTEFGASQRDSGIAEIVAPIPRGRVRPPRSPSQK